MAKLEDPLDLQYYKRNKYIVATYEAGLEKPEKYENAGKRWSDEEAWDLWNRGRASP